VHAWGADNKTDDRDAEMLARIARFDPKLLSPITHRARVAHRHLAVVKARDALVRSRTDLVNFVRGTLKTAGIALPKCSTPAFGKAVRAMQLGDLLWQAVAPVVETIEGLTVKIRQFDRQIVELCRQKYAETARLQQVAGVGPVTALAFVLTLEDPKRFRKSREVGPYLGLVPKRDQSGQCDKPLSITKAGNTYLRRLLVSAANYILGPFGPDCDLRRYGERIASRGGKVARRKAKVAVARKLAVLLHRLWESGDKYQPIRRKAEQNRAA
jgi:transposase